MKKIDPVAHQVAKKAAALQMRNAAKWRVEAQNTDYKNHYGLRNSGCKCAACLLCAADRSERLAREWNERARCALDPEGHALQVWKSLLDEAGPPGE